MAAARGREVRYFPGTEQTLEIILDGDATAGALALMRLTMPPGAGAPPHRHTRESETVVVLEGELSVVIEGDERTLLPGDAAHFPLGALHSFRSEGGGVVEVVTTPAGLEDFFRTVCPSDPDAAPPSDEEARAALERAGLDFSGA